MTQRSTAHRGAAVVLLAVATASALVGCGQTAAPAGTASPTSAPPAAAPASAPASATAAAAEEPAGADVSAVQAPVDPGEGVVGGPQLSQNVSDQLTKIVGRAPDSVTCPDLAAKVGATVRCVLVDGADRYGVTVTATSVQGTNVNYDIKVDEQTS